MEELKGCFSEINGRCILLTFDFYLPELNVVIEYDGLENGITQDLIARGIAKEDIILAFLPDSKNLI